MSALLVASSCARVDDPKAEFLGDWLTEHATALGPHDRRRVVDALFACERAYSIDALLLLAVMEVESTYDPNARSRKGARGLMQIRPATASEVAERIGIDDDVDDPATSVRLAGAYLAELKERFGTWHTALAAYNHGPRRIRQLQSRGKKVPTRYASRVRLRHRELRAAYLEARDARPVQPES